MLIAEDKEVDIFVASRIGSFKHIKYHTDTSKNSKKNIENLVNIKTLQKDECITRLEWGNADQTEILVGRKNQQIQIYNTLQGFTKSYTADFAPGHVVGLGRSKRKLLAAVSSGVVKVWSKKAEELVNVGKVDRMRVSPDEDTVFATGGEENDLKLWRIGEPSPTFVAKNLAHDWLQLRRPVWVSDLLLLSGEGGRLAAVCSRHGYVRLYDSRAQRRPVINVDFENMAATCIASSFDERQVLVGFGRGQLHQVDLRKGKPDKGYKGSAGAITDIAIVRDSRLVVSCSLDRQLRVHEYGSKELVYKQYLTSKLSCVLVQEASSTPLTRKDGEVKEEEDPEDVKVETDADDLDTLFENMEPVGEKPKKQKQQVPEEIDLPAKKIRPSSGGCTDADLADPDDAIKKLLRSTEKLKKKREQKKREKKAKSVFHNA
ncbi:WD repeat-containing protein 74-like [Trichoplusia ni]|uniref:WD repeat-containing protein 74-like n=1 Tax=Trichoplusia ni TaxID=7111 RepID=A0A7E5X0H2_TRINI|nr:WD repeat-containing protein 74-like [Trichoplusia ni]XP_026746665.1 WD repeat-containing protein 74-like [Trichoplusia ni]